MAVLRILRAQTNNILRSRAAKVYKIDIKTRRLLEDMLETLKFSGGLGLAAPQVGAPLRLFVVRSGERIIKFVNPVIVRAEGRQMSYESCLSLPGIFGRVVRPALVAVSALDENGRPFRLEARDQLACIISHEADHLDGILFTDRAELIHRLPAARPENPYAHIMR